MVSSKAIAQAVGVDAAIVRKDLGYFGEFGTRGVGYNVAELHAQLKKILGLEARVNIALLGVGRLGSALALYTGFHDWGLYISALFDVRPELIGARLGDITVQDVAELEQVLSRDKIEMAVLTLPREASQQMADRLVRAGVKTILNFSPQIVKVPEHIILRNVDMSIYLATLSFYRGNQKF
jgi:redox-sensing transcriptional repressor